MVIKSQRSAFGAPNSAVNRTLVNSKSQFASPSLSPRQAASDWIRKNPAASRRARAWLDAQIQDGPLHGSLLAFARQEFGVPKPVSAWVKTFPDLIALPPGNATSRHPLVGLRARMTDPMYLAHVCVSLATENAHPEISVAAEPPATAVQQPAQTKGTPAMGPETILVDAYNILRSVEFGTQGLAALLRVLKAERRPPFSIFDAPTLHVLRERNDAEGVELVTDIVAHGEGKIVPAGTTADEVLLTLADKFGLSIVSLDTFSEYAHGFPWTQLRLEEGRRVHHPAIVAGELIIAALGICATVG